MSYVNDFMKYLRQRVQKRALNLDDLFWDVYDLMETRYPALWMLNLFVDQAGEVFALASNGSNKLKLPVTLGNGDTVELGEPVEVVQEFTPVTRHMVASTSTQILRAKDNLAGWLSVSATSLVNRTGSIDSRDLFDSFVAFAESTGFYPIRTFYHMYDESLYSGQSHVIMRVGNCYVTAGTYFGDSDVAQAEIRAFAKEPDYWGESIGFLPTARPELLVTRDFAFPVYTEGINFEISTLPEAEACNWFTNPSIMEVRTMGQQTEEMVQRQKAALAQLFEVDMNTVEDRLARTAGTVNGIIEQNNLITRNTEGQPQIDPNTGQPIPQQPANVAVPQPATTPQTTPQSVGDEVVATTQDLLQGDGTLEQLANVVEQRMAQLSEAFTNNMAEFRATNQNINEQIVQALEGVTNRVTALEQSLTTRQTFVANQPSGRYGLGNDGFSPIRQRTGLPADNLPTMGQPMPGVPLQMQQAQNMPNNIQPVQQVNGAVPGQPADGMANMLQADVTASKLDQWNPVSGGLK